MTTIAPPEPGSPADLIACADNLMRAWRTVADVRVDWAIGDRYGHYRPGELTERLDQAYREVGVAYGALRAAIDCSRNPPLFS